MINVKLYRSGIFSLSRSSIVERRKERILDDYNYISSSGQVKMFDYQYALKKTNSFKKSLIRTRSAIKNIVDNNKFDYFLTITFNENYVDRYSAENAYNAYKNVIKRLKYQFNGMTYLQVPEFHKDGAIHFHLFCKFGKKPKLKFKGITSKGQHYYTITNSFKKNDCFLTLEKITSVAPCYYLTKYITKSSNYPLKRKYACSRDIKRTDIDKPLVSYSFADTSGILLDGEYHNTHLLIEHFLSQFPCCRSFTLFGTSVRYHNGACAVVDLSKDNIKDENIISLCDYLISLVTHYCDTDSLISSNLSNYYDFKSKVNALD